MSDESIGGDRSTSGVQDFLSSPPPTHLEESAHSITNGVDSGEGLGPANESGSEGELTKDQSKIEGRSKSYFQLGFWNEWRKSILHAIANYFRRVFAFPLVSEPISFSRHEEPAFDEDGLPKLSTDQIEELCNYDKATKELFQIILEERKEIMEAKDKYHYQEVDLSQFPGWDETVIERLKSTFQVFDVTGDGLIDFEEMSSVLAEFGDRTSEEIRRKHFDAVDIDKSGAIDFEEFLTMTYNLTKIREEDADPETVHLGESYRLIDRNMSRIRSLDVVQQLQAGLF